jgi:hypothetical protein
METSRGARPGYKLAGEDEKLFWEIQILILLNHDFLHVVDYIERNGVVVQTTSGGGKENDSEFYRPDSMRGLQNTIKWNSSEASWLSQFVGDSYYEQRAALEWYYFPPLVILAHEMAHAYDYYLPAGFRVTDGSLVSEEHYAVSWENIFRYAFFRKVPGYEWVRPRPAYGFSDRLGYQDTYSAALSGLHPDIKWEDYFSGQYPLP